MNRRLSGLVAGAVLGCLLPTAAADTAYVVDRLLVGLHEDKRLDSTIIEVIPTGTVLDVVERDGEFARVRTEDGSEGWVDAGYLMDEEPAIARIAEFEQRYQEAARRLQEARGEVENLRRALADSETPGVPVASDTLRDLQRVAEENQRLKDHLRELEAALDQSSAGPDRALPEPARQTSPDSRGTFLGLHRWQWAAFGFALLLAMGLGAYAVDYDVRRRHGGFRV